MHYIQNFCFKFCMFLAVVILCACGGSNSGDASGNDLYQRNYAQAAAIYDSMTLPEKIGQLVLPSYMFLANSATSQSQCTNDVANSAPESVIIHECGIDLISKYHIGAVLTGGGPWVNAPTAANWQQLNQWMFTQHAIGSPKDPLLLTGQDAIRLNMHVQGGVMGPHNIGLGVTHNPDLIKQIGTLTAQDSLAIGFNWVYAPTVAVAQDLRWGRFYESYAQDPKLVSVMGEKFIEGAQGINNSALTGVLATAKHFIGDGGTQYGLDEGDDQFLGSQSEFWSKYGQPYESALNAQVGSIMASYSAMDGDNTRMHFGGKWDILNQLKGSSGYSGLIGTDNENYQFSGFVVADWNGATRAAYLYDRTIETPLTLTQAIAKSINAGVDMIMVGGGDNTDLFDPSTPLLFSNVGQIVDALQDAVNSQLISEERLKDAVVRIIATKLAMKPEIISLSTYSAIQAKERTVALQAAEQSLVLLKNDQTLLPIKNSSSIQNVVFIGDTNDVGLQNGGWSINWQGQKNNHDTYFLGNDRVTSGTTTIQEGVQNLLGNNVNYYYVNASQNTLPLSGLTANNTLIISVVSEQPYAEFMGDIANPSLPDEWYQNLGGPNGYNYYLGMPQATTLNLTYSAVEQSAMTSLRNQGIKSITVVYSGRPVIISDPMGANSPSFPLNNSDVVIAAFLPGSLGGQAITNAIFGRYLFGSVITNYGQSNTLTFPWPANMEQVDNHFSSGSLFPVGYGLTTTTHN